MNKIIRVGMMEDVRIIRTIICKDALAAHMDRKPVSVELRDGKNKGNVI